jgi:hypothetical protein
VAIVSIEPAPENQASGLPMIVVCEGGNYDMGTDKLSREKMMTKHEKILKSKD